MSELRLLRWRDPAVLALAVLVAAAGFCQFGVVAALADIAEELGQPHGDESLAEQAGLSGTAIGVGLAIIRLASLVALPLAALADRFGRQSTVRWFAAAGVAITAAAALSPTYAWFVAIIAVSRPLLTATNTVATVAAAELTTTEDRARAMALLAAAYGVGSGLVAVIRGIGGDALGFRGLFALALVPLAAVVVFGRGVRETERFTSAADLRGHELPVFGAVAPQHRRRLLVLAALVFAISVVTGPANSFFFLYAEDVLDLGEGVTALVIVLAGAVGLAGLLAGRAVADRLGRRIAVAGAMVLVPAAGILTYSGSVPAVVAGYLVAVLTGSAFLPAMGSLQAELFPTSVRSAVAGWLVTAGVLGSFVGLLAFGIVADADDRFGLAAALVFTPAILAAGLVALVPETRGWELDSDARG